MNPTIAVAGLSARLMAESACRGGYRVLAMDVFGDVDTRRAASAWTRIGEPATMQLDADRTLAAFAALRREPDVLGWIAGAGFESMQDALARAAEMVPLLGNPLAVIARVRDPETFFGTLDALGVPHPETAMRAPEAAAGWLAKDARGSGAWHIRAAGAEDTPGREAAPGVYFQRQMPGRSMGALFVADGRRARVAGFVEQTIRPRHGHPYVYCGMIGPVELSASVRAGIERAVQALTAEMGLTGMNSLDFLLDEEEFQVLEVNARPSSSLAIFDPVFPRGLVHAHVEAHLRRALPEVPSLQGVLRGNEIVFAGRACTAYPDVVAHLVECGWCHDIPQPDTRFTPGEPICTVSAEVDERARLHALIAERCAQVNAWIGAA